jgi:CHASE3 domain sensor protein
MTLRTTLLAAYGVALIILGWVGALSYRSVLQADDGQRGSLRTHLVLEKLDSVLMHLVSGGTNERGSVLSGEHSYPSSYKADLDHIQADLNDIGQLTSDNLRQQQTVQKLRALVTSKLAEVQGDLTPGRQNRAKHNVAVDDDLGKQSLLEASSYVTQMKAEESRLLVQRSQNVEAKSRRMKGIIVLGNLVAVLFLALAAFATCREMSKRNEIDRRFRESEDEVRALNVEMERRNAELVVMNRELESFSYSVSHDLRSPLRHIAGFSQLLLEDYSAELSAEAQHYLKRIHEGTGRMSRLIDELLSLSRLVRQELKLQVTALKPLVEEVIRDLKERHSQRSIEWNAQSLPLVECDPALLKQVFTNLLSNAVKFTSQREHAVIEIGSMNGKSQPTIFVRDNGVGFSTKYADKLFGMFQRLHPPEDFPGDRCRKWCGRHTHGCAMSRRD